MFEFIVQVLLELIHISQQLEILQILEVSQRKPTGSVDFIVSLTSAYLF